MGLLALLQIWKLCKNDVPEEYVDGTRQPERPLRVLPVTLHTCMNDYTPKRWKRKRKFWIRTA